MADRSQLFCFDDDNTGLAFFYGGLVRTKNMLNILMQCLSWLQSLLFNGYVWLQSSFGSCKGALAPI